MSANDMDFDVSPSRKSSVLQLLPDISEHAHFASGRAIIQVTPTARGVRTGLTHETGEIDERKEIETAKTDVGGAVKGTTGTGIDEADPAIGPTETETERGTENGTENAATAAATDGRE